MTNLTALRSTALTISQIVRVRFPAGSLITGGEHDFYFGSLAAVFDMFSEVDLGVSLRTLYSHGLVADGLPFISPLGIEFKKLTMYRKAQKNS